MRKYYFANVDGSAKMVVGYMLEGFLHHKKEEKDYICSLVITEDRIDAALWDTTPDGKVTVIKTAKESYASGDWENAIESADKAISTVEEGLPEGVDLKKVVFGLFQEWLVDDRIKDSYLQKIKKLTSTLQLTPLGFVELPMAVAHLLTKDEGTQQTVILVGWESKHVTVSVYKIGKLVGSQTRERSGKDASDVEEALVTFSDIEILPSRMLLYGTAPNLDKIKADLLNHPWQKKANFLHFPKIEILTDEFTVKAVSYASATEITHQTEQQMQLSTAADEEETTQDSAKDTVTEKELDTVAEDLGFTTNKEVGTEAEAEIKEDNTENEKLPQVEEVANVEPVVPKTPKIKLPKLSFTFKIPRLPKVGLIIGIIVILLIAGASVSLAYWYLPTANVTVLIQPQTINLTEKITVDPKASQADAENRVLPSKSVTAEVSGTATTDVAGKKTVGDKAKGEVTIYNKTLNSKTFKKGSVLNVGKLKFTLDNDVSIASASEGVGSLTYGTTKASLTASDIGTASNISPGNDFTFTDLPASSYTARNDKAFTGGTSREVTVVSRDDQKTVREQAQADLEKKGQPALMQKLSAGEKLLDKSVTSKIIKESFSKEVGEEAKDLTVNMTASISALAYNETDFNQLLTKIAEANIPSGYEYKPEDAKLTIDDVAQTKTGTSVFSSHIIIKLLPKVEIKDLAQSLAGKTKSEATEFMRNRSLVAGVEISVEAPLSFLKQTLPKNPGKIKITVENM